MIATHINHNSFPKAPLPEEQRPERVRTFRDPKLLTNSELEKLSVEETQKILIEDPPGGLD